MTLDSRVGASGNIHSESIPCDKEDSTNVARENTHGRHIAMVVTLYPWRETRGAGASKLFLVWCL